jgi:hypothetical protein
LLVELHPEGGWRLFELWKQIPERRLRQSRARSPLEMLCDLLIRMSEHWPNYRVFDWQKDVPWTNNGTEQAIGKIKMRNRTLRGYFTKPRMLDGLMLAGSSAGETCPAGMR